MKTTLSACAIAFLLVGINTISKAQNNSPDKVDSSSALQVSASEDEINNLKHNTYIAFDSRNNSYSFEFSSPKNYGSLFISENRVVRKADLLSSIKKLYPQAVVPKDTLLHAMGSITIDKQDRIYLVFYFYYPFDSGRYKWKARIPLLLYSNDHAQSFTAYKLPNDPDMVFLEKKSPFEEDNYPPLIGYTKNKKEHISPMADLNEFGIFIPRISPNNRLVLGNKIVLTGNSPGISNHTGGESFASTFGNITSITFNEIPAAKNGNNIIVADLRRQNNKIIKRETIPLIVKSKYPYPDVHVTPVIVSLKNGEQDVFATPQAGDCYVFTRTRSGASSTPFKQSATLRGPRVYVSALTDGNDNMYVFYDAYKPKPGFYFQKYDQQTKSWGGEQLLAYPPKDFASKTKDNFGIYYFKAAVDLNNNIYTSFTFFDTYEKKIFPRYVLRSVNKGRQWSND